MNSQPAPLFSRRLREDTRRAHTLAENTDFLRGFLRGVIDEPHYLQLLADLHTVYAAMEKALDATAPHDAMVSAVWLPGLRRLPALEQDLATFAALAGIAIPPPSAAARRYVRRIEEVAAQAPHLLVAHAYTRYLGDLSGGQVLKSLLRRALALPEGTGTAFYEFAALPDLMAAKRAFRAALDTLPEATAAHHDAIVTEANHVFALNLAVFRSLEGNALTGLAQLLVHTFFPTLRRAA
jgi:heme oxygenase (biliverdin-producing, ferredoxin)